MQKPLADDVRALVKDMLRVFSTQVRFRLLTLSWMVFGVFLSLTRNSSLRLNGINRRGRPTRVDTRVTSAPGRLPPTTRSPPSRGRPRPKFVRWVLGHEFGFIVLRGKCRTQVQLQTVRIMSSRRPPCNVAAASVSSNELGRKGLGEELLLLLSFHWVRSANLYATSS